MDIPPHRSSAVRNGMFQPSGSKLTGDFVGLLVLSVAVAVFNLVNYESVPLYGVAFAFLWLVFLAVIVVRGICAERWGGRFMLSRLLPTLLKGRETQRRDESAA